MGRPLPTAWQATPVIGDVVKWLNDVCQAIEDELNWIITKVYENLPGWVKSIFDWLWKVYYTVSEAFISFFKDPVGTLMGLVKKVYDFLPDWVKNVFNWMWRIFYGVGEAIYSFFRDPVGTLSAIAGKVYDMLPDWVKSIFQWYWKVYYTIGETLISFFRDPVGTLRSLADRVWSIMPDWLKGAIQNTAQTVSNLWTNMSKWFEDVKKRISDSVENARMQITAAFDGLQSSVASALTGLWDGLWKGLSGITTVLGNIGRGVVEALKVAWGYLQDFGRWAWQGLQDIGKGLVSLGTSAVEGLKSFADGIGNMLTNFFLKPLAELLNKSTEEMHKAVGLGSPQIVWTQAILPLAPLLALHLVFGLIGEAATGAKDTEIQILGCKIRPGFLNVIKALDLRGLMGGMFQGYLMGISMAYFSGTVMEQLRRESLESGRPIPPDPSTAAWMLRKGLITQDLYQKALARQGIMKEFEKAYLENIWNYPPYADMIKIFVREAYEETWPEAFKMKMEDYPEQFGKWMELIGYKEEWAKRLWAAHWVLPSTEQVYGMLHRGLKSPYTGQPFKLDDVKRFLKEADIDPRWRENLVDLSYELPGRIEARWGIEWGIWDEAKFEQFLRAEGMHPDWIPDVIKIEKANVFREHLNAVKSVLVSKYQEGYIDETALRNKLKQLGFPEEAIALIVWSAQEKYDLDWKKDMATAYMDAYSKDKMSADELRRALSALGMTPDRIDLEVERLTLKKTQKAPAPETLDKRLSTLKSREASLVRQLQDRQTDLEDLKKIYAAEMDVFDKQIDEQEARIAVAKTDEQRAREQQQLEVLKARREKAKIRYEARISDLEETIRMIQDRLAEVRAEIQAMQKAMGKTAAS